MGPLVGYLGGLALAMVIVAAVWSIRQRSAARRLKEIDEGKRCVACNSTATVVTNGTATCQTCGHQSSLADYQRAGVSADEIAAITKPKSPYEL